MGGMAPEAPHIYKKGGRYYLLIAEGATEFGHCATLAAAPAIWGPYTPCPTNPVLRAASPTSLFQTVGHADLFADGAGAWWAVALASRVVGEGRPIGRETVLLPVDWRGEWPVVDHAPIDVPVERLTRAPRGDGPVEDVLRAPRHHLLHLRVPAPGTVRFPRAGAALLAPQTRVPLTAPLGAPAFVGVRQRHLHFVCEAELALSGTGTAGLAVYLDHERSYAAAAAGRTVRFVRVQPGVAADEGGVDVGDAASVHLRVVGTPEKYVFECKSAVEGTWETIGEGPTSGVSGGFTGTIIAVYAVLGEGEAGGSFEVEATNWRYWAIAEEW
jgi:xylan 1,4-beta-xylosidase